MAAQERIIGGGFLIIGVGIALILVYFFTVGGESGKEAYDEILTEVFPSWETARKEGDYIAMKNNAQRLLDTLKGSRTTIETHVKADATSPGSVASRLKARLDAGTFEKNVEGLYGFRDGWYQEPTHRALTALSGVVLDKLKGLRRIREAAGQARDAVELARLGSKGALKDLAYPPALAMKDDAPIVDPNPVYEFDRELYRVFGLAAEPIEKALQSTLDETGTKAWLARRKWNKEVVGSGLRKSVDSIPEEADKLSLLSVDIGLHTRTLAKDDSAKQIAKSMLEDLARQIGAGLKGPRREAFNNNIAAFTDGDAIANVLRTESTALSSYLTTVRALAAVFDKKFQ